MTLFPNNPPEKTMKNILLYADEGTSDRMKVGRPAFQALNGLLKDNYHLRLVDKHFVNRSDWEKETALFIIPGGRTAPHYKNLSEGGNNKIIHFVRSGGKYLGLCAGGYYGSARTEFEKGHPLEICFDGPLNFFKGVASGPAYGPNEFEYNSDRGTHAACVNGMGSDNDRLQGSCRVYFNGGCAFLEPERFSNTRVLSRFLDIPDQPAAVIECRIGKGIAILSGVHPEYPFEVVNRSDLKDLRVYELLKQGDEGRERLLIAILLRLNVAV